MSSSVLFSLSLYYFVCFSVILLISFYLQLDWSAERQVLIPTEHFWCDFKSRPWAKNSPNTNDLYIHYMDKSTGTLPSLEEKRALPNYGNKDGNIINALKYFISIRFEVYEMTVSHMYKSLVFGDEVLAQVMHLKFSWDQDLAFCRPVKFFHTDWIIISLWSLSYTQRHCHVRIETGPVQTVAIKLEAHNSLEYHYMLKH